MSKIAVKILVRHQKNYLPMIEFSLPTDDLGIASKKANEWIANNVFPDDKEKCIIEIKGENWEVLI